MERIKLIGDENPAIAMSMLDSLQVDIDVEDEHELMNYELLRIRLKDKAYIMHTSDLMIKKIVSYFDNHGSSRERQEAYFYAGSTYRDLQDTPRAIYYYLKSQDVSSSSDRCDSLMLRNTYSNLQSLFFNVQDNKRALEYAKKEYAISRQLGQTDQTASMHLGNSYMQTDSMILARKYFDEAFSRLSVGNKNDNAAWLLYFYSNIGDTAKAKQCFEMVSLLPENSVDAKGMIAKGRYYTLINKPDSSIYYYDKVIENKDEQLLRYDAARYLFHLYYEMGDTRHASAAARKFMGISDTLNLGQRQEMASTVNNQFKYNLDKEKEHRLEQTNKETQYKIALLFLLLLLIILMSVIAYLHTNRKHKLTLISMSDHINEIEQHKNNLVEEIKQKERLLQEEKENNASILNILRSKQQEPQLHEILDIVEATAEGTHKMTSEEWMKLMHAVDIMYPDFPRQLRERAGKATNQQLHICYLMRVGIPFQKIQDITGLTRVTVWRWSKKCSWIYDGM
ncbi:MAG: tetratricopeptide repeat protein [Prevotella sp.]